MYVMGIAQSDWYHRRRWQRGEVGQYVRSVLTTCPSCGRSFYVREARRRWWQVCPSCHRGWEAAEDTALVEVCQHDSLANWEAKDVRQGG